MKYVLLAPILVASAGAGVVLQQALNASLRTSLNSAAWSGLVSYLGGTLCMALLVVALREPVPSAGVAARVPWWAWSGGFFGAIYIVVAILLLPRMGAATFVILLIAGQMLASVALDHFGWLGLAPRAVDLPRVVGVALLIGAVALIRR